MDDVQEDSPIERRKKSRAEENTVEEDVVEDAEDRVPIATPKIVRTTFKEEEDTEILEEIEDIEEDGSDGKKKKHLSFIFQFD